MWVLISNYSYINVEQKLFKLLIRPKEGILNLFTRIKKKMSHYNFSFYLKISCCIGGVKYVAVFGSSAEADWPMSWGN